MALFYGTQATLTTASQTSPIVNSEPNDFAGRVRIFFETYTIVAASAVDEDDLVIMGGGRLPKGARIIDGWINADADISDETALIGVETLDSLGNTTVIISAFDADAGAVFRRIDATEGIAAAGLLGPVMAADARVQLHPTGELNTDAAVITLMLLYVID